MPPPSPPRPCIENKKIEATLLELDLFPSSGKSVGRRALEQIRLLTLLVFLECEVDGARNIFNSVMYRSGLRFGAPRNGEIQGKCVVGLEGGTHCR